LDITLAGADMARQEGVQWGEHRGGSRVEGGRRWVRVRLGGRRGGSGGGGGLGRDPREGGGEWTEGQGGGCGAGSEP
jgi:hypothetical protein